MKPKSKALIWFMNGLGNFIELTSAIVALSNHYKSTVDLCLDANWQDSRKPQIIDIAEKWDRIDKVIQVYAHEACDYLTTINNERINKTDYELLFATGHNTNSPVMSWFGEENPWERAHWRTTRIEEVFFCISMVYKCTTYRGPIPPLEIPLAEGPDLGPKKRMRIALCNGSARSETYEWEKKRWWGFPDLADLLMRYFDAEIHFVGRGSDDLEDAKEVKSVVPQVKEWVSKNLWMTETAKVLSQCDLLVTTDTSVMHCGAAVGVPLVALFGPTLITKNKPWTDKKCIIKSPVQCSPCQYHYMFTMGKYLTIKDEGKPYCMEKMKLRGKEIETYKCMRYIQPDRVMRRIRDFWKEMERRGDKST